MACNSIIGNPQFESFSHRDGCRRGCQPNNCFLPENWDQSFGVNSSCNSNFDEWPFGDDAGFLNSANEFSGRHSFRRRCPCCRRVFSWCCNCCR